MVDDRVLKILYVDDETALLDIGKLFLERLGTISVDTSPSARESLDIIAKGDYDGIVSDYQMPGMDGIEFLKEVRARFGDIPFILFTGRGREEIVIQAIDYGADFYLQKGGDPKSQFAELGHKIKQAVRRKEAERAVKTSEKRLSDIIDFLPDPTFAIDVSGTVIAWNHALEKLTGTPAVEIIGKGKEEYSAAFYHSNRPVLIDLIDEPDETIRNYYSNLERSETTITAETDFTRINGSPLHILVKVSRLYDQSGMVTGAIESIRDITQLTRALQEIRKSEERYRSVVNDQTEMIARFTPEGVITFTNAAYSTYYEPRIGLQHPVGKNIRDIMEIANYDLVDAFFQTLTPDAPVREMERKILGRDGNTYWQIWTVRALFDAEGNKSEFQVVGRDITDQKLAQERLRIAYEQIAADEEELREKYEELALSEHLVREHEQRLVMAQEIAHTGAWEYNTLTNTLWGSAECQAIFGFDPVPGVFSVDKIDPYIPDRETVHKALLDLIEHDIPYDIEFSIHPADGSQEKYIHSRARSERDNNGNVIRVIGVIQDITPRKKAEYEVAFKNAILQTQQEVGPDGILLVDKKGRILEYNKQFQSLWRIPDEIVVSHDDEQVLSSVLSIVADPDEFLSRVRYLYAHPEEKSFEEVSLRDGTILERYSAPMSGRDGEYYGRVWYFRDITTRKRAEEELQAAYEQLQASEQTLQKNFQMLLSKEQALQESEHRFRSLFDLAPYACILYNQDGVHLLSNPYHEKITGYTLAEMEGKRAWDFGIISPEVLAEISAKLHLQGYLDGEEVGIRAKDGTLKTVLFSAVFLEYQGQREVLSTMVDVSERRRIEDSLRRSNDQITGIANTIPGIVFQFYAKDSGHVGLSYVSNRVTEILGISGEISTFLDQFTTGIVAEDRQRFQASIDQALKDGSKWNFEGRFRRSDGHLIHLRGMSAPVREQDGLLYSGVILDVTTEKEADTSLQSERQFTRLLLDTSPVFIVAIGADGRTIMMNRMLLDALEYSEHEVQGKDYLTTFVPAEDQEMLAGVFSRIVSASSATLNENHIVSKSGKVYLVEWRGRPVLNRSGDLDFFVGIGIDITERNQAEEALSETSALLDAVMEHLPIGIWILNENGEIIHVNPAGQRIWAGAKYVGVEQFQEYKGWWLDTKKQIEPHEWAAARAIEKGEISLDEEIEIECFDKTRKIILNSALPLKDDQGNIHGAIIVNQDITDRTRAERELQQSRDMFRAFIDHSYDAVFIHDPDGLVLDVNSRMLEMYQVTRDEALRYTIADYTGPDSDMQEVQERWLQVLSGNDQFFPWQARRPNNGTLFDVEVYLTRITIGSDPIILGNVRDITERKQMEKARNDALVQAERFKGALDKLPSYVYMKDRQSRYTYANQHTLKLFKCTAEELIGSDDSQFFPAETVAQIKKVDTRVLDYGEDTYEEIQVVSPDGNTITYWEIKTPIYDYTDTDRVVGLCGISTDITEQKQAEASLWIANRKLNLLSSITRHDISNQLTVILSYLSLLGEMNTDPEITDISEKLVTTANRITSMIQFTREYEQIGVKTPVWQDVSGIVSHASAEVNLKSITVYNQIPAGTAVYADSLIVKVFYNLIDNSARYAGSNTTITFSSEIQGSEYCIICEDDGAGIPDTEKERIFERGVGKNTGMGLFLAREVLSITGISIREHGIYGRGARFEILVPAGIWRMKGDGG